MKTYNFEITVNEVDFQVQGVYYPYVAATHEQPPEGGYFEVDIIEIAGYDVTEIIQDYIWDIIEEKCYNLCEE